MFDFVAYCRNEVNIMKRSLWAAVGVGIIALSTAGYLAFQTNNFHQPSQNAGNSIAEKLGTSNVTQKNEDVPAAPTGAVEIASKQSNEQSLLSDALRPKGSPSGPVGKMAADYRAKIKTTEREDWEVVAAISYCANNAYLSHSIGQWQGEGKDVEQYRSLYNEYRKYCADVGSSTYALRQEIFQRKVDQGDVDAMANFYYVGPRGWSPPAGEGESIGADELRAWHQTAVGYLEAASTKGDINALSTLASIYASNSQDDAISDFRDPIKQYAYQNLWYAALLSSTSIDDSTRARILASQKKFESQFPEATVKKGKVLSNSLMNKLFTK